VTKKFATTRADVKQRRNNQEDSHLHTRRREILKSHFNICNPSLTHLAKTGGGGNFSSNVLKSTIKANL
jgi:hypothetical protein